MRYSVQHRHQTFEKGYGFSCFAKTMGKNIGKNISTSLNSKYSQNLLDHDRKSATNAPKTSPKIVI